jgi:hypothetical protein
MDPVGARVRLRDAETLDDLGELMAPEPVEPGDVVASVAELYIIEAVLVAPPGASVVPVLARCASRATA